MPDTRRRRLVDARELARFVFSGATAATANIGTVLLMRSHAVFEISVVVGVFSGFVVSFVLSKWFAFRSSSWRRMTAELRRFIVVYALSSSIYWLVAVTVRRALGSYSVPTKTADLASIFVASGIMMLSSYLGHRFFTYRHIRRGETEDGIARPSAEAKVDNWSEPEPQ